MASDPSKAVGIWIRVSTEDQARGESPEHHEARARMYAQAKDWEVREVYHGLLMGNCGYGLDSAEQAVASGAADLISIGRPFISNPDLVERWANDWPLNPDSDMATWYTPAGARGYTDFPAYQPA